MRIAPSRSTAARVPGPSARRPARRTPAPTRHVEAVEQRILFHLEIHSPVADQAVAANAGATQIDLSQRIYNEEVNPVARFVTNVGNIDIELLRREAPLSVTNFLNYLNPGRYNGVVFHRSIPGFIIQTGGYTPGGADVTPPGTPTVPNEFSPSRSNVRATVAYAKLGGDPNSATSEWFVNLADNSGNLDNQNGGFTVFGRVVNNTMTTADAIAAMPRTRHESIPTFTDLPVTQTYPATSSPDTDDMVVISTAALVPDITYTVTSSDPALVQPTVNGPMLALTYGAGRSGLATVTVTATEAATGATVTEVFDVAVGLFNTTIGDGGNRTVTFVDADGTQAVITTRGGTASVNFQGENITQQVVGTTAVIGGQNIEITNISLSGAKPSLSVTATGGDGRVVLRQISASTPVRSVSARTAVLRGSSNFAAGLGRLDVLAAEDAGITIGGDPAAARGGAAITLGSADDTDITSSVPIRTLRYGNWTGGDADADVVSAPSINVVQANDLSGTITAGSIRSVRANTMTGATINVTQPPTARSMALNSLNVTGAITDSTINAAGNIGSVVAGAITGSNVYAGVTLPTGVRFPAAADVFTASSGIRNLTVRNRTGPAFVNSVVAASVLGRMNLGIVQTENGGTPMGLASALVQSISVTTQAGLPIRGNRLDEPTESMDQGDFEVRIF